MFRLDGKVALVTGGARGIGAEIARAMVAQSAKVVIGDVLDHEGEALAAELGASAKYVHLDVTKPDEWGKAVATAVKVYGKLNVLVNNAGIAGYAPIEQYTNADWERIIAINLTGVFNGIKAAVPALKNARGGSIVNISSMAGLRGEAGMSGYVATKWAVRGLTKSTALELASDGIRVNSIHPGVIRTPLSAEGPQVSMDHVAMNRVGEPIEIANLAVFLASDESSFSTGVEFVADGGETAGLIRHVGSPAEHTVSPVEVTAHV